MVPDTHQPDDGDDTSDHPANATDPDATTGRDDLSAPTKPRGLHDPSASSPPPPPHTEQTGEIDGDDGAVTDADLVRRAVDGYVDAFEVLVHRHTGAVYRTAVRIVGDSGDAQDITQETLLAAWRNLTRFRGDSAFSTWLYQIVTRRALNHVTRGRTRHLTDLLSPVAGPGDHDDHGSDGGGAGSNVGGWDPRDDIGRDARHDDPAIAARPVVDAVTAAVLQLPPPQRAVIVLHHFEGLPYAEVADVTGSTVAAVRSHLFRARRTLTQTLKGWG